MTCTIGFTDKSAGVSWLGGDSLSSNGYTKNPELSPKVFRNESFKNVLIGGTTTFRHLDLLRYTETLFDEADVLKHTEIDHRFMVTKFIPKVISLFKDGVVAEDEKNRGGNFIVATPSRVFEVQNDYSVLEPEDGMCAVGCGWDVAMGSLVTTAGMDLPPQDRIILALKAAERCCCGVQRPFRLLCTDERDEIIIH